MISLCFDDVASSPTLGYPNLAKPGLAPDEFDTTEPRTLPLRLLMYLQSHGIGFSVHAVTAAPPGSWYPVALGWHDFDRDYFDLMTHTLLDRVRQGEVRVLFYYHEGDNPERIVTHMDALAQQHDLPGDAYLLVSANSAADRLERAHYFADHDYFFRYVNRRQSQAMPPQQAPSKDFTALVRTHKWWRATVMADLWRRGLLQNSIWSYQTACTVDDDPADSPIRLDDATWTQDFADFQRLLPRYCDTTDSEAHNDHRMVNVDLYHGSKCHVVIETMFDVDQSGGAFLTEKTYKCIKYGQPFVIAGGAGSLAALRRQGYRVFDGVIDNSYDDIQDANQRWQAIIDCLTKIQQASVQEWWEACREDMLHNQHQFQNKVNAGLEGLVYRLTNTL